MGLQSEKPRTRLCNMSGKHVLVGATYVGELMQRAYERGFDLACRVGSVQWIGGVGFQQESIKGDLPCVFAPSFGCEHALTHREETPGVECPCKLVACS